MNSFHGFTIVEQPALTETVEDWSQCRSVARAKRRAKRRFKQRVIYSVVPSQQIIRYGETLIMHPIVARQLRAKLNNSSSNIISAW